MVRLPLEELVIGFTLGPDVRFHASSRVAGVCSNSVDGVLRHHPGWTRRRFPSRQRGARESCCPANRRRRLARCRRWLDRWALGQPGSSPRNFARQFAHYFLLRGSLVRVASGFSRRHIRDRRQLSPLDRSAIFRASTSRIPINPDSRPAGRRHPYVDSTHPGRRAASESNDASSRNR